MSVIQFQPGFILHKQDWDDRTEQVELLTPDFGRVLVFCRKNRKPMPLFQQLDLDLSDTGENVHIKSWVASGKLFHLQRERLYFGLYLNEILMRLYPRNDPSPRIFGLYSSTLTLISKQQSEFAVLRYFERTLLQELGYGIEFNRTLEGDPVLPDSYYEHIAGSGFQLCQNKINRIPGSILLAINENNWSFETSLKFARIILAREIDVLLGDKILHSRALIRQFYQNIK